MAKRRSNGTGTLFKRTEGGPWLASWFDHTGKRMERSTRTTDRAAAERILTKRVADAALRRDGVVDPSLDEITQQARRTIESHLNDYEARMQAASRSAKHIKSTLTFIRSAIAFAGWKTAADINADDLHRYAGEMRTAENRSNRTINHHLTAVKGFAKWLANHRKLPRDPLALVRKPNVKVDRRRERRMLLPDEWRWLRPVTANGPERYGVGGAGRALLYATAIQTGLRANEIRSLTRGRLFLNGDKPYITCKAGSTKNRKDARQYIQPDLAAELREHVAAKAPRAPVFAMPSEWCLADMLRADLAEARRQWLNVAKDNPAEHEQRAESDFLEAVNHEGERFDFHSLRHTCGAWLAMSGAHPKAVQAVMRHSTIVLTMDTYGHLLPGQEADTVARFADYMGDDAEALRATGTADVDADPQQYPRQLGCDSQRDGARGCDDTDDPRHTGGERKSLRVANLCDATRSHATCDDEAGRRKRAVDMRVGNPQVGAP
ncbi:MAG: tyrosine-type recombinase/integrase [Planctomycetes bacterium]|nr:tyrosine-type recombinase/integrase [Planctomycetota bacterium]